jgi:hypothetical protein
MHVSLTRVSSGDKPIEQATMVAEEMDRWLRDIEGYEGFLMISRPGTTIGLSFWESREAADLHRAARMQFIERMAAAVGVEVEEITPYDVAYANLAAAFEQPGRS